MDSDSPRNDTAEAGCRLYLTKPLGIGILTTAEKKGLLRAEDAGIATALMCTLNTPGARFGKLPAVAAMTDVTGFGLLGHLRTAAHAPTNPDNSFAVKGKVLHREMLPKLRASLHRRLDQ